MFLIINHLDENVTINKKCVFIKELFNNMERNHPIQLCINIETSKWSFGFLKQELKKFCSSTEIEQFLTTYPQFLGYFI
jgi:hypothetical protein